MPELESCRGDIGSGLHAAAGVDVEVEEEERRCREAHTAAGVDVEVEEERRHGEARSDLHATGSALPAATQPASPTPTPTRSSRGGGERGRASGSA
jgi:hypothetical protein